MINLGIAFVSFCAAPGGVDESQCIKNLLKILRPRGDGWNGEVKDRLSMTFRFPSFFHLGFLCTLPKCWLKKLSHYEVLKFDSCQFTRRTNIYMLSVPNKNIEPKFSTTALRPPLFWKRLSLAAASRFPRRFPEEMGAIFHCAPRETTSRFKPMLLVQRCRPHFAQSNRWVRPPSERLPCLSPLAHGRLKHLLSPWQ